MVDHYQYCLDFVVQIYGVVLINFDEIDDLVVYIIEVIGYYGVDVFIDVVGFEVKGSIIEIVLMMMKLEGFSGVVLCQVIVVM